MAGRFAAGRVVFYDDGDGGPLAIQDLPDQRSVMADIPPGATRVVVVAPVWVQNKQRRPGWLARKKTGKTRPR